MAWQFTFFRDFGFIFSNFSKMKIKSKIYLAIY